MIVDPDFLDHWRTGMVVDALGDAMAPMYILRLWSHCQERKSDTFAMPTRGLKAQCKFPGDAQAFEAALVEAGFLERAGETIRVCGWAEKNASLLAAWGNGSLGGRPKKTQQKPMGNPTVTQPEPTANQSETHAEPIREEKRREEKKGAKAPSSAYAPPEWVPAEPWMEFVRMRKAMRNIPFTDAAAKGVVADLEKLRNAGHDPAGLLTASVTNGWRTVYPPKANGHGPPPETTYQRSMREKWETATGRNRLQPTEVFDVTPVAMG